MQILTPAFAVALLVVVLLASAYDLRYRRIPNTLTASSACMGFILNLSFFGLHGLLLSTEGLLLALLVYLPFYLLKGMGAGDVKLMAALGALVGPAHWFFILLGTAFAGGLAGAAYAFVKGRLSETCCNLYFLVKDLAQLRAPHLTNPGLNFRNPSSLRMPHGVIIAVGSLSFVLVNFFRPSLLNFLL